MGPGQAVLRDDPHQVGLDLIGVLPADSFSRWARRKTWVSTAMAGSIPSSLRTTLAVCAPPRQGHQGLAGRGNLAAVLLDEDAAQGDDIARLGPEKAMEAMKPVRPSSPRASIFAGCRPPRRAAPVALFTETSVAWAERTTATSRVKAEA